jgi:hypothetical protein
MSEETQEKTMDERKEDILIINGRKRLAEFVFLERKMEESLARIRLLKEEIEDHLNDVHSLEEARSRFERKLQDLNT